MEQWWKKVLCVVLVLFVTALFYFGLTPAGRADWNQIFYDIQKADDTTRYATKKQVEDSCRAMIASYTSDRLIWEQYKDSDSSEQRGWADQAKMRANKTASSYNHYILKNSYVWDGNVPEDIRTELETIVSE